MLFSGIPFLYYFLPVVLVLYFAAPEKLKNTVLLLSSLFFYGWGEKQLVLMLIATVILGWLFALFIEKYQGTKTAKVLMIISVAIDLGLLGYYKYADFFIGSFNRVFGDLIPLLHIALPIGISFYTFQILSYTVDVYRGTVKAQHKLIPFATYVALFPQLIAGPIVRYADIEGQLEHRSHTWENTAYGVRRFMIGLGKKVIIANAMGALCVQFRGTTDPSVLYHWMYAIAYMLQIYYDFSGYSDMAIGLGRIFGFTFLENFNYPYIANSITEFWRRWHMSLSYWFRDYVYIPLGGNRKGLARQLFNIFVVWSLTGLWHGAAWNFVLWGMLYAVLLMIEKLWLLKHLKNHNVFGHVYVLFMVMMGFVLFNAADFSQALADMAGMFGLMHLPAVSVEAIYYLKSYGIIFLAGIIGATPLPKKAVDSILGEKARLLEPVFVTVILIVVTAYLVDGSFNPFLYFRF